MSDDPWTLFWPRSGSSAEPGRPTLPVIIATLQISCTTSEPYLCSVTPRPQMNDPFSAWAYRRAASSRSAAGTPVISSTASGLYSRHSSSASS